MALRVHRLRPRADHVLIGARRGSHGDELVADRAGLMANQESSTLKVMKVDERLARIEAQLREQNEGYERRIEKLTVELSAAKEENRELIRAQIMQVKAEMEAARARLVAEVKETEGR